MISKSVVWGFLLLTLAALGVCFYLLQGDVSEGFQAGYTVRSLEINVCPLGANEIQTARGYTDCCRGDLLDGKCNGTTFCTKSPAYEKIPSCQDAWRKYYDRKGKQMCPRTIPNYYEDVLNPNAIKGCSVSPIQRDGKQPTNGSLRKCRIYATQTDNQTKADSCYLEKERLKIRCPAVNGRSPVPEMRKTPNTNNFELFFCQYPFEIEIPDRCVDEKTAFAHMDRTNPSWRNSSTQVESLRLQSCRNYISERNKAFDRKRRLEEERRRRLAAEERARKAERAASWFRGLWNKIRGAASKLQQQLDDARRKLTIKKC